MRSERAVRKDLDNANRNEQNLQSGLTDLATKVRSTAKAIAEHITEQGQCYGLTIPPELKGAYRTARDSYMEQRIAYEAAKAEMMALREELNTAIERRIRHCY